MSDADTIVAAATPPGRGGVGVVRVSGPKVPEIAAIILGEVPAARHATFSVFLDAAQESIDAGIALYFPAPHSYTGEDVLELQGHGGPVIIGTLVARVVELGARRARPGEFTERAFLNDKLDLAQAEAVADLIDAGSREAARAAMRSLQGEFSTMIKVLTGAVIDLRVHVEAAIDFPEEEIDFLSDPKITERLADVRRHLDAVERAAGQGRLLRDGMTVVLAGSPNAGKSSLLNRLAGYEAAIVTAVPGTTRDVLRERIHIDGMPLHILDTAGLRKALDIVEEEGIRRAQAEMSRADRVLFVIDGAADPEGRSFLEHRASLPPDVPVTLLFNKSDLAAAESAAARGTDPAVRALTQIALSARTGAGLEELRNHLKACMGYHTLDSSSVSARQRHLEALARARASVEAAARTLQESRAGELTAQELRGAQQALSEINGEFSSEDLLGKIFGSFCIGK